jgi:polar amino acid transport system substrate-binding protein
MRLGAVVVALLVLSAAAWPVIGTPIWEAFVRSFRSNVLQDQRYLIIWDGIKVTFTISFWSILWGGLLGGLLCRMRMGGVWPLVLFAKVFIAIQRGIPLLVVLMISFHIVFASVNIDPVWVAVLAFGFNLGAYSAEIYRSGIEGIPRGQTEAGLALGFSRVQTFVYIIAPQALRRILPVLKGEIINLVKMTSIVGYIAVQDLTRAADIIRSRTFDAFFPLIMVAVLYFLISWILLTLLTAFESRLHPRRRIAG